jgi:predicted CXXCH cytochrome family protein
MLKRTAPLLRKARRALLAGLIVGLIALGLPPWTTVRISLAAPLAQEATPTTETEMKACGECHLDIAASWSSSPHAHAFDDPVFQERWSGLGFPGDCLSCHTTNYIASSNTYSAEGVACEACHGLADASHPPAVAPIKADTDYCGSCHTTTLHEWKLTGHASADVGCMDCHDPHSQGSLFEVKDDLCINCHKESMGPYLEDLHIQKGIGCVDCHALVVPPDPIPVDGIVPTGHAFTITPGTCVACHTDALHAGFSLPGYESGAKQVTEGIAETQTTTGVAAVTPGKAEGITESKLLVAETSTLSNEQRIQALETALASRQFTTLFQGGFIGLVLGSTTAWLVSHNTRRTLAIKEEEPTKEDGPAWPKEHQDG